MNTKGMKFLAVLAVLAMAFAAFAVLSDVQANDATDVDLGVTPYGDGWSYDATKHTLIITDDISDDIVFVTDAVIAGPGTTDAIMAEHGYKAKMKTGTGAEVFYTHLENALATIGSITEGGAIPALTADVTATLLGNDQAAHAMNVLNGSAKTSYTLTIDLNGFKYTAYEGISRGGVDGKAISFGEGANVIIKNGTIDVAVNDDTAVVIKSYAPSFSLINATIDGSKMAPSAKDDTGTVGGAQFNNTDIGKSVALWIANGSATIDQQSTIKAATTGSALLVHGFNQGDYVGSDVTSNGANIDGKVILADDGAVAGGKTPVKAKFVTNDGTTVAGTVKITATAINANPAHTGDNIHAEAANFGISIEGGVFADMSVLPYLKDGKTITINKSDALVLEADLDLKKATVNVGNDAALKITGTKTVEAKKVPYLTGGTFILATGASLTGDIDTAKTNVKVEGSSKDTKIVTPTDTTPVEDIISNDDNKNSDVVITVADNTTISSKPIEAVNNLTIVGTGNVTDLDLTVTSTATEAKSVTFSGFTKVSGTIKTTDGTTTQTMSVKELGGTFTITKGSIIIEGDIAGQTDSEITLNDNTDVKIAGSLTAGTVTIKMAAGQTKGANLSIIAEKDFEIKTGAKLIIENKVAFTVSEKVFGAGTIEFNNAVTIANGGELSVTNVTTKKAVTAEAGSKVSGAFTFSGDSAKLVAVSGSDIMSMTSAGTYEKVSGKDAASGTWAISGTEITYNNYEGTYNIPSAYAGTVATITLVGNSSLSYTAPATYAGKTLFGAVSKITTVQGSASLVIDADLSASTGAGLVGPFKAIDAVDLEIDAVALAIYVTGSNSDWTEGEMKAGVFYGIDADSVTLYNADLDMSIMALYATEESYGIKSEGAVKITSCADVSIMSASTGLYAAGNVDIKDTTVSISGQVLGVEAREDLSVSNYASLSIMNGIVAGTVEAVPANQDKVSIMQESVLEVDMIDLFASLTNNGKVVNKGNSIVRSGGSITNSSVFENSGLIGVYGTITNATGGTFQNDGAINVYSIGLQTIETAGTATLVLPNEGAENYALKQITIAAGDMDLDANGNIVISDATLLYQTGTTYDISDENPVKYTGTLKMSQAVAGSYTLSLSNGIAAISIAYDASEATKTIGKAYTVSLNGSILVGGLEKSLESNTKDDEIAAANNTFINLATTYATAAALAVNGGTFTNDSTVVMYKGATPVGKDGTFKGDFTTYAELATIAGTMNGNITSTKAVTVSGTMTGDIKADGNVIVSKKLTGDITTKGTVTIVGSSTTVATVVGDVIMQNSSDDRAFTLKGKMDGTLIYNTKYNTATSGDPVYQEFTATMDVKGEVAYDAANGMVITATKGAKATTTEAAYGGFFVLTKADALAEGKTVDLKLTAGKFAATSTVTLPAQYSMVIEDDTTIEVKKVATFNIAGGLKVSDGAIKNYELVTIPVTYGKLTFVMTFDIAEGYTVFSNVEYALSNCDENSELKVGSATTVTGNVAIKAGVNVIVENVELNLSTFDVDMAEGAKITLVGSGKVSFGVTGSKTTSGVETMYTVNGTVAFGDSVIVFEDVRFDAASVVNGIAATSTSAEKLNLSLVYDEGKATLVSGIAAGAVTLKNDNYTPAGGKATKVSGIYAIDEDTVSEAFITDAAQVYTDDTQKTISKPATAVVVAGTMKVGTNTTIKGGYAGAGMIYVNDGKTVTIENGDGATVGAAALMIEIGNDAGAFDFLVSDADAVVTAVAATSSVPAYVKIAGEITAGAVEAEGNTATDTFTLNFTPGDDDKEAIAATLVIPAESTLTVLAGKVLTANGVVLNAGTFNYKTETETTYGDLVYEITFEQDAYVAYTKLANALEIVDEGTEITLEKNLSLADKTIPADVSITIADGYYLTVEADSYLEIGEGITTLGAGGVLTGDIYLAAGAYIIDYPGSGSDISVYTEKVGDVLSGPAKENKFIVLDIVYATVYAASDMQFTDSDAVDGKINLTRITPKIVGYYFNEWQLQNGNPVALNDTKLSAGPFSASMVASKVSVVFVTVPGINYYVDGVIVNTLDAPMKVVYGATVTAKISDPTQYEGTPLVNGETYILIDDDTYMIIGSGVTPIGPSPTEKVKVTVKYVQGVNYFKDGIEFSIFDTPVEVQKGSVFTAKISDTTKYTGDPVINGQHSVIADKDMTLEASGVEPVSIGNGGINLTDILLIVLVILIAVMVVVIVLRLNRS